MARVDHDERRRAIAEAVWRLMGDGGVDAASVRAVVAETGLSSGSIRFFFSTQAELHVFAMSSLAERVRERVRAAAAEPDLRRRVVAMVAELMPLRDDTERELGVWLSFLARARHDDAMARVVTEQAGTVREFLSTVLGDLVELGPRPATDDLDAEVRRVGAIVDGLTLQLLTAPTLTSRAAALATLEQALLPGAPDDRKDPSP